MTVDPGAPSGTDSPPAPLGVHSAALADDQAGQVIAELFGCRSRSTLLDAYAPGEPQWLLAELGDGRITGGCPGEIWRFSGDDPETAALSAPLLAPDRGDAWRLLDAVLFSPSAQIHIAEGAEAAWVSHDSADAAALAPWLRPRDRSFLLTGWRARPGSANRHSRTLDGDIPFSIGRELSGSTACHPVTWQDFEVEWPTAASGTDQRTPVSAGSWVSVREYWAEDPVTGAVGVAFHRLTGYHAGPKPTAPLGIDEPDAV
ncbi:hypothetical protein ACFO4E_15280 [Nocardiopsis mangrovi]|uniref:Uncharacterized protein n=1 Tax=Nocardiopsis mangrovi TaxID=1179818 RepID=A0ABV9DYP6_9ACTN